MFNKIGSSKKDLEIEIKNLLEATDRMLIVCLQDEILSGEYQYYAGKWAAYSLLLELYF